MASLSTYCGSMTQRQFWKHIGECEVCFKDSQERDDVEFDPLAREPGDRLLPTCTHTINEDCMNCRKCGLCKESVDDDEVCDDCR